MQAPVTTSQMRIVLSYEEVATSEKSGERTTLLISSVWPTNCRAVLRVY